MHTLRMFHIINTEAIYLRTSDILETENANCMLKAKVSRNLYNLFSLLNEQEQDSQY